MPASVRALLLSGTASLLILGAAGPVCAADATAAQAATMESQVRDAIRALLGPAGTLANSPVKFTAAGDHYDVSMPIPLPKLSAAGGATTDHPTDRDSPARR